MSYTNIANKLKTISGITITPMKEGTREIDWAGVRENVEYQVNKGVEVLVPCGNTSEFYSLTLDEAKEEIKQTVEVVNGRAMVVAGIGYSVDTAIELGQYAAEVGADAVMIHMPIHPYLTSGGVKEYFENIMNNLDIPTVIYFKNPNIDDSIIAELAENEKFVGVKYAINDIPRFAKTVKLLEGYENATMICGTAEKWAPFYYSVGAEGFTSGLVNVYPEKSFEMLHALQNNDFDTALQVWHEVVKFEDLRAKFQDGNNVAVIKASMEMIGLTAGVTREPVDALTPEDQKETFELLKRWGFDPKK